METAREILTKIQTDPKWAKMNYLIEYKDVNEEKNKNLNFDKI